MTCSRTGFCTLFTAPAMRRALGVWRSFYCEGDPSRCARLKLFLAGETVPPLLLPNGKMLDLVSQEDETAAGEAPCEEPPGERSAPK